MLAVASTRAGAAVITLGVVAAALLSACTGSTTSGAGSPAASVAAPVQTGSSTSAATSASATSAAPATSTSAATPELIATITGTGTVAATYKMSLWAHDVISDCGAHSYGQPIIDYFAAHPCRSATRRLWTTTINGRAVGLSVISVSAQVAKLNDNPDFQYAQQLVDLENADNTGSVNDLLREGKRIPGAGSSIPSNEVFSVLTQDGLVVIMDGWYLTGTTSGKDPTLTNAESDLSFSDAAAPDA